MPMHEVCVLHTHFIGSFSVVTTDHRNQWSISFERHGVSLFSDIFFEVEVVIVLKYPIIEFAIQPFGQMYLLVMITFLKLYRIYTDKT